LRSGHPEKNELRPACQRPWGIGPWGIGQVSSAYWRRLEALLALSARAYDPRFPLVCFEERPCLLPGDVVEGLAPPPGRAAKEPYAYRKPGACCVLAAVAPLTGRRLYQVRGQRTKRAYTQFRQRRATHYPDAEKIRLGQDNLNTHLLRTFYGCLPAALARKLAERFEVCYPPKAASWLNRIELDFSALARQCLQRRIPPPSATGLPGVLLEPTAPAAGSENSLAIPS
jgi:hypothetical protein